MKIKSLGLVLLVALVGLSLAGCSCFQQAMKGETPPPPPEKKMVVVPPEQKPEIVVKKEEPPPAPPPAIVVEPMKDIYFDFDKYNIRSGDAQILNKGYAWLQANPGKVRIEGNCDERGTVEYNLALGQKRADAAKAYLVNLGADPSRLETVSYGKEKPVDPGHNEEAWAKNRRDNFTPLK